MEIRPVSLTQIAIGRDGRRYEISGEAGRVAQRLQELDPRLRVEFNEGGNFFVVLSKEGDKEDLVLRVRADEWDGRVVKHMEIRAHEVRNGISAAPRLDAHDAVVKKQRDHEFEEEVGERAGVLFRALQRDLGTNPRIFVPGAKAA